MSDHSKIIAPPPVIYAGLLLVGLMLEWIWPARLLSWPVALGCGAVITLAGALGVVWGVRAILRAESHVNPYKPTTALVTTGPFRFSRNPIYLAVTFVYVGLAVAANAIWPLLLLPLLLVVMYFGVIFREEEYLEKKFGEAYLEYKRRVRRWI